MVFWRSILKQAARQLLIPKGRQHGLMAVRDRLLDAINLAGTAKPVIVDGGAYVGDVANFFLRICPGATIYAYEPIPWLAQLLRIRYRGFPNIYIDELALGDEKLDVTLHVTQNEVGSSVLLPTPANRAFHGGLVDVRQDIVVRQVCLQDCVKGPLDILKV